MRIANSGQMSWRQVRGQPRGRQEPRGRGSGCVATWEVHDLFQPTQRIEAAASGPLSGDVAQDFGTQTTLLGVAAERLTGQAVSGIAV